jgi:peptide deformylase
MKIIKYPHELLTSQAEPVTVFDKSLVKLLNTMSDMVKDKSNNLAGLSGNQVGVLKQVFVANMGTNADGSVNIVQFVNPKINANKKTGMVKNWEGCASLPSNMVYLVNRYKEIEIVAKNVYGTEFCLSGLSGHMAYVCQHEVDHLRGINLVNKKVFQTEFVL